MNTIAKNKINFPPQLLLLIKEKANQIGVSIAEYTQNLAISVAEESSPVKSSLTEKEAKGVGISLNQIKKGQCFAGTADEAKKWLCDGIKTKKNV